MDDNHSFSTELRRKNHVVLLPFPAQGQIAPMMQLALTLASQHNFTITFVNNRYNHNRILQHWQRHGSTESSKNVRSVWLDDGLPPDYDYSDYSDGPRFLQFNRGVTHMMQQPFKDLLLSMKESPSPPCCVVVGPFCRIAKDVASELGFRIFLLWTQAAAVLDIYVHLPKLVSNGFFSRSKTGENDNSLITYISGLPPLEHHSFPAPLHEVEDISTERFKILQSLFDNIDSYDGILINSFKDLEKDTLVSLQSELQNTDVLHVGPLLPSVFLQNNLENKDKIDSSAMSLIEETRECIEWLNSKPKQSVLYISFGSVYTPSEEDFMAMAMGVKASQQPFLWVMRKKNQNSSLAEQLSVLPEDFMEETKERGLFIPWAPQLDVLSHPSVGAFLTHCGWNSVLESISMGVPLITFPGGYEQPTNSKFIVDIWKVGMAIIPVKTNTDETRRLDSNNIARTVMTVLHAEEGNEIRKRVQELSQAARRAVQTDGTSYSCLETFVANIQE